jgi:hypothetical protein
MPDLERSPEFTQRLRALPSATARPYDFEEFRRRAQQRARAGRAQALAAGAMVAVAVLAVSLRFDGSAPLLRSPQSAATAPDEGAGQSPHQPAALLEHYLAGLPQEPAVAHLGTRAAVLGLEDRIAQLDDLLSAARADGAPQLQALQQERTRLVGTLLQVRYAETLADDSL